MKSVTVISNSEITPGTLFNVAQSPEIARQAQAGQFVMVACGEAATLRRPISVHSVDGEKLALLYMVVGKGTEWLTQRKAGAPWISWGRWGMDSRWPDSRTAH
jgi:dihydroorotate dehydrogenase electron transfer subunit